MAATKTPTKTTAKTNAGEGEQKAKREFTAQQKFEVVDELPEGATGRGGRTSPYIRLAERIAAEAEGKWVNVMTTHNVQGAATTRRSMQKFDEEGRLPKGNWEFSVRRFNDQNPHPDDPKVRSALYVKFTK